LKTLSSEISGMDTGGMDTGGKDTSGKAAATGAGWGSATLVMR